MSDREFTKNILSSLIPTLTIIKRDRKKKKKINCSTIKLARSSISSLVLYQVHFLFVLWFNDPVNNFKSS